MKLTPSLSIAFVAFVGCSSSPPVAVAPASCPPSSAPLSASDQDGDGLDDAMELAWAQQYMPFLSISAEDHCPTAGVIVRVTPAQTAGHVLIRYDVLYNQDCGVGGHVGDDERFAITIDPTVPPPDGILGIKAISHKGSVCEKESDCGGCAGQTACATLVDNGTAIPAVWVSRDKHGNYVNRESTCQFFNTCVDDCDDNAMRAVLTVVNVGEPCAPLVRNLTTMGFITTANGWTNAELLNYDPWGGQPFGGGDPLLSDLTDSAFDTTVCP